MRMRLTAFLIAAIVMINLGCASARAGEGPSVGEWISLFNGKDLDGWRQINGTARFEAKDGMIVGSSVPNSPNSFLCTTRDYGDFELEFEVMVDRGLNSGVQFRSLSTPEYRNGRVHGYQVEIAINGYSGCIYDEARRARFLNPPPLPPESRTLLKADEWNHMRVRCLGDSIQTWVNGVMVSDIRDSETARGFIGLQVHDVGDRQEPLYVRWRNLRLRELKG